METLYIYIEEKPKRNWFKKWSCDKKVKTTLTCTCTPKPKKVVKKLVDVEYDWWNNETTYTYKYSL